MCGVLDKAQAKVKNELLLEIKLSVSEIAEKLNMTIPEVEHIITSLNEK